MTIRNHPSVKAALKAGAKLVDANVIQAWYSNRLLACDDQACKARERFTGHNLEIFLTRIQRYQDQVHMEFDVAADYHSRRFS